MIRVLILTVLTWLILGAAPQNIGDHAKQPEAKTQGNVQSGTPKAAPPIQPAEKAENPNPPCEKGEDNRQSDLCAQWKAADAANLAAQVALWVGIGGLLVGALTLGAAVAAALFARKAALETEKGAQAAMDAVEATKEANRITRESQIAERLGAKLASLSAQSEREEADKRAEAAYALAKRNADAAVRHVKVVQDTARLQARAFVGFWEVGIEVILLPEQNDKGLAWRVRWKNTGTTPAHRCQVWMLMRAFPTIEDARRFEFEFEPLGPEFSGIIAPGAIMDGPTAVLTLNQFRSGSTIIAARVEYVDVFSKKVRVSEVRMVVNSHPNAEGGLTFAYVHAFPAIAT